MPRRWPLIPTVIVALACATMVALGVWQLGRAEERDRQAQIHAANSRNPELVAFPRLPPVAEELLYRRSSVTCLDVTGWEPSGGTAADGTRGFRFIAQCRTGAEGPGVLVDMGVSTDPATRPVWQGGEISGRITLAPQEAGMVARLFRTVLPARPLLVSEQAAAGLAVSAPPDPTTQGNSSWAYAIQWFLFAVAAAVIYVLALRRLYPASPKPPHQRHGDNGGHSGGGDGGVSHSRGDDHWGGGGSDGGGDGGGGGD